MLTTSRPRQTLASTRSPSGRKATVNLDLQPRYRCDCAVAHIDGAVGRWRMRTTSSTARPCRLTELLTAPAYRCLRLIRSWSTAARRAFPLSSPALRRMSDGSRSKPPPGSLKSIQRGVISMVGAYSGTATITAVDTSKTELRLLGVNNTTALDDLARVVLTNATTIAATRGSTSGTSEVSWG